VYKSGLRSVLKQSTPRQESQACLKAMLYRWIHHKETLNRAIIVELNPFWPTKETNCPE